MATFYVQSAFEDMNYEMLWSSVVPSATTITDSVWAISPSGPTVSAGTIDALTTIVNVEGLTNGEDYTLTNSITLSNDEKYESSIFILGVTK